jgi:hypothetical protein
VSLCVFKRQRKGVVIVKEKYNEVVQGILSLLKPSRFIMPISLNLNVNEVGKSVYGSELTAGSASI